MSARGSIDVCSKYRRLLFFCLPCQTFERCSSLLCPYGFLSTHLPACTTVFLPVPILTANFPVYINSVTHVHTNLNVSECVCVSIHPPNHPFANLPTFIHAQLTSRNSILFGHVIISDIKKNFFSPEAEYSQSFPQIPLLNLIPRISILLSYLHPISETSILIASSYLSHISFKCIIPTGIYNKNVVCTYYVPMFGAVLYPFLLA
jgi:hypothetical protein